MRALTQAQLPGMPAGPLPRDPRTIAEMWPVREAEIKARKRPRCSIKGHGPMVARPLDHQTYEVMWCGVWYDCARPGCGHSATYSSRELAAYHGEPYVVDETHAEMWDGAEWVPISEQQARDFWATRVKESEDRLLHMQRMARAERRRARAS